MTQADPSPGLTLCDLHAGYGGAMVLHGVSGHLAPGEVVSLLGRNGAGRSTLLRAIMGLLPLSAGQVVWHDGRTAHALHGQPAFRIARCGIGYVPESRDVFPRLSVRHNLLLGEPVGRRARQPERWPLERLLSRFPVLAQRLDTPAGVLSGGEQQMLALARALMSRPRLLLMDEPSVGLAPKVVAEIFGIVRKLHAEGTSIFLVEQNVHMALKVAQHFFLLQQGRVTFSGTPADLAEDDVIQRAYLAGSDHSRTAAVA